VCLYVYCSPGHDHWPWGFVFPATFLNLLIIPFRITAFTMSACLEKRDLMDASEIHFTGFFRAGRFFLVVTVFILPTPTSVKSFPPLSVRNDSPQVSTLP